MSQKQFHILLLLVLLNVFLMSMAWEFWLEDITGALFFDEFGSEDTEERWEYVYSITVFSFLSLIYPYIVGKRLIARQEILTSEIRCLSVTDELTEMNNRRKMRELFNNELKQCRRYGYPLAVILIDIDFFKRINDEHGHTQGDQALKEIASLIKNGIRETDHAGRWGGEEFLILCPETSIHGGVTLAEKLRDNISRHSFSRLGQITASFGVTEYRDDASLEVIFKRADRALYTAKAGGRNAVVQQA